MSDWLLNYIAGKHPDREALRVKWLAASDAWSLRAGFSLTAQRVEKHPEGLDLDGLLDRIEAEMASADRRAQWTMNTTLVNIGIHHPSKRERAVAIGEALGIYGDLPEMEGCTSPYAPVWIAEMVRRQSAAG